MQTLPFIPVPSEELLVASCNPAAWEFFADEAQPGRESQASGGAEALAKLEGGPWRWLLLDRQLPDLNADEVAKIVRARFPKVAVLMLHSSRTGTASHPAKVSKAPSRLNALSLPRARSPLAGRDARPLPGMIGQSEAMLHLYRMARLVAGRDITVLITGETGTGKEMVAQGVHQLSARGNRPLVTVNCAAIPESLLESELFGHTRGAFTGAVQTQIGRFQAAHGGTLFLDEIGELPLALQPKLLRFLETKEIQRLGSADSLKIDVRVIAATNADLERRVEQGQFREDLFYRLAAFCIEVPSLRTRGADIELLARHFAARFPRDTNDRPVPVSSAAMRLLQQHPWKGNVRELQLVVEQACILADGDAVIAPEHLRFPRRSPRMAAAV